MKWNVLLGTLVLAFGLCAQSYGFDLLDRMLGKGSGCGCDPCATQKGGDCKGASQKDGCGAAQKDGCGNGAAQKNGNGNGCCQKDGKGNGACQKNGNGNGCCQKDGDGKGACQKDPCGSKGAVQKGLLSGLFGGSACCNSKGGVAQKGGCCQKDGNGACQKNGNGNGCCQKDGDGKGACQKDPCGSKGAVQKGLLSGLFGGSACCSSKGGACQKGGNGACQKDGNGKDGCCQKDGNGACQKNGNGNGCCQKDGDGKGACQKDPCGSKGSKGAIGGGLLDKLFGCNRCSGKGGKGGSKGCDDGTPTKADPGKTDKAPMPPAPVVDPSAFLNTRRVIPVTHVVR